MALAALGSMAIADQEHSHAKRSFGTPGKLTSTARIVSVSMDDTMRFTPSEIAVKQGETVRFVVKNLGTQKHEMVLGHLAELKSHAELMQRFPNMQHDEPNMVSVAPGAQAEFVWRFTKAGKVDFACLLPGHFEAGMRGKVSVK